LFSYIPGSTSRELVHEDEREMESTFSGNLQMPLEAVKQHSTKNPKVANNIVNKKFTVSFL
jgi:hypothetical protein